MDIVNSVTQNSNNRNEQMENRDGEGDDQFHSSDGSRKINKSDSNNNRSEEKLSMTGHNNETTQQQQPLSGGVGAAAATKSQVPEYLKAIGMDPRKFWPRKYRFTREKAPGLHNPLSIAQRNFYELNGYLVVDDCVSQRLVNSIREQYSASANQSASSPLTSSDTSNTGFVDEYLIDKLVAKNQQLLSYVKCFCDDRAMLMTHSLVAGFQTTDSVRAIIDSKQCQRQQLVRDWLYLPFRPIDKVVCALTALEPIDHVILVVPGTHRIGQCSISSTLDTISQAYDSSQENSQQLIAREIYECSPERLSQLVDKSKKGFRYVNLKAGQTLFYHPGLIHGFSDDLVNFKKRQLSSVAYYAACDCEYVDLRRSIDLVQPDQLPISLAHFKGKNPTDYTAWIGSPKLLQDTTKANL